MALEAICDYNLYFWHVSFAYPGSLNDLNVLNISTLLEKLTGHGLMRNVESDVVPYRIGNEMLEAYLDEWNKLTNHFEHKRLQDSVVEQISSLKLY